MYTRHMDLQGVDRAEALATQLADVVSGEVPVLQMVHDVIFSSTHLPTHGTVELGHSPVVNLKNVAFQIEPVP